MATSQITRLIVLVLLLVQIPENLFANEKERLFQFGFFPPISSNGLNSAKIVNTISLNLIGGYSGGTKVFEMGGVWNVSLNYTKGLQVAGLLNYTGKSCNSVQTSGFANIAASGKSILQIAGLLNVADKVNGLQFSALVNVAKKMKGVQFGLINYVEDGGEGVSVGLVNIVKHGGKYELEVSFSEAINTIVSFRLGTDRFYTIFSGGLCYNYVSEYAVGLGFGTSVKWKKRWSNQIEIQAFGVSREKMFMESSMNSIIQLRLPVCKEFAKHFKIFVGPTLNLELQSTDVEVNTKLSPWTMWKKQWNQLQATGWAGLSAGLRF